MPSGCWRAYGVFILLNDVFDAFRVTSLVLAKAEVVVVKAWEASVGELYFLSANLHNKFTKGRIRLAYTILYVQVVAPGHRVVAYKHDQTE